MPDALEIALTERITRMCVAKEGATTYYVDGSTGNDGANGLTWESAKKTIQAAVDIADSWADIYVKAGTYVETVSVGSGQNGISIIGENSANTIIHPGGNARVVKFYGKGGFLRDIAVQGEYLMGVITWYGDYGYVKNVKLIGTGMGGGMDVFNATHMLIDGVTSDSPNLTNLLWLRMSAPGGCRNSVVKNCHVEGGCGGMFVGGDSVFVHDNTVEGTVLLNPSIEAESASSNCSIYHNNVVNCAAPPFDDGTGNSFFENYYSAHSNIDNGSGIATLPYAIAGTTGNSDPRPVTIRNGWLAQALSGVSSATINAKQYEAVSNRTVGSETFAIANTEYNLVNLDGESANKAYSGRLKVRLAQGHQYIIHKYTQVNAGGMDEVGTGNVVNTAASEVILDGFTFNDTETIRYTVECDSASGQCDYEYAYASRGE